MKLSSFIVFILSVALTESLFAQPIARDSTFGINGVVTTNIAFGCQSYAATAQTDGKIVAVGYADIPGLIHTAWGLARYNPDGTLDTTFGDFGNGYTTNELGVISTGDGATSVAIGPNGKIVGIGYIGDNNTLAQFNSDGSLDSGFGDNGRLFMDTSNLFALAVQQDGGIIVAGETIGINHYLSFLSRYSTNGILDNTFNQGGIVTNAMGKINSAIFSIAIQPDGKIITGGISYDSIQNSDFALARYNVDGSLDSSFNGTGINATSFNSYYNAVGSICLQPDGKIIAGGGVNDGTHDFFSVARYNSDGTLDPSFGVNGRSAALIYSGWPRSIALQSDGKIVEAGYSLDSQKSNFALVRFNNDGMLDSSFGTDGIIIDSLNGSQDQEACSVIIQGDDKIVAVGYSDDEFVLARYLSSGNVGIIDLSSPTNSVLIYPNPIEASATLKYTLQNPETISIRLLDMQEKVLKTFTENENQESGEHQKEISFPEQLPSGFYFLRISGANGGSVSVKVVK